MLRADRAVTGFTLAAQSERWFRSAVLRCVFLAISAGTVAGELITEGARDVWAPVLALLVPSLGTYLAIMSSKTNVPDVDLLDRERLHSGVVMTWARDPITRRLVRFELISMHKLGPNVSGVLEFLGAATLGALLYWFHDSRWALVSLAGTIAYLTSINVSMYLDPSNYYPKSQRNRAFSALRAVGGPVAFVVALAVALPAFTGANAAVALAICSSLLTIGPRIRETDAHFRAAAELVERSRQEGRTEINLAVHNHLLQPVGFLFRTLEQNPDIDRAFFDDVRNINSAIREILTLDRNADKDLSWPGVLVGRAEEIMAATGMGTYLRVGEGPISDADRKVARLVMDEFLTNAVKSGAEHAQATVTLIDDCWVIEVSDDGRPIDPEAWLRPYGGLSRLKLLLRHNSGRIERCGPKTVRASWRATLEDQTP